MTRATVRQEVRPLRFEALYERRQRRTLTMAEAAELLEITERTVRRWSGRYATEGAEGLQDRRRGRASARAVPVEEALRRVSGMRPGTPAGPSSMSTSVGTPSMAGTALIVGPRRPCRPGHGVRVPRRGAHRTKRPRKPLPGMMRHQDGSTHEWGPGCQWDLIVMVDDATTEISLAFFVEEAGTLSSFRGLQEVMERTGLFSSLYAGRGRTIGTPRGGGHGRYDPADPGASRVATTGHHAASGLFTGRAGPVGTRLPHPTGPIAHRVRWPGSPSWRRRTGISPSSFSQPTTRTVRCRPPKSGRPSSRGSARPSPRFSVCKTNASSPTTIPGTITARACRSRKPHTGSTM